MFKNVARPESCFGRVIFFCLCSLLIAHAARAVTYNNPIIADGADPWVVRKDGFYYYTQTTGNNVRVRKASRITGTNGLGTATAVTVFTPTAPYNKAVWAPELHYLNGKWYVYYAADDGANANHRMFVAEATTSNPQEAFSFKGKISDSTDRWAIDGTVLEMDDGRLYFIWSGWPGGSDGLQNLYIAPMSNPWTISGPRVLLSTPTLGWEGWINEGPQVIKRNGKIFIVYSANASWTDSYCLGLLTHTGGDVANASSWTKAATPLFKSFSDLNGAVYGPGHCSFAKSLDGTEDLILYHAAKYSGAGWERNVRVQRFTWNANDTPNLDVPIPTSIPLTAPSGERPAPTPVTTYTLGIVSGSGSVRASPQQLSYKPGSVVTLTASDYAGIRFAGWTGDVWKTNHTITVTMDRNKTATANFNRPLLLIDNPEAQFTGEWSSGTISTQRVGIDYSFAHTSNTITHTVRYRPNIVTAGRYDIHVLHSAGANRSTAAPWFISTQDGTKTVHLNQQINGGVWQTIATGRKFSQGTAGFVQLANNTGEPDKVVIADAVAFVYSADQDVPPLISSQPLSQTVPMGGNITLEVETPGTPYYQWIFGNQPIPGATDATLSLSNFNAANEGLYRVLVTNAFGSIVSSNALLKLSSPVRMDSFAIEPSRSSRIQVFGNVGSNYVLETSETLDQWLPLQTNLSINGMWEITLQESIDFPRRFYRVKGQ